jgi:DNA-binding XRE family transcriptional regulator
VIMAEAVRRFSDQTHTLELCKWVISKLTPHIRKAVGRRTMRPESVFTESGIEGLLRYLLVRNCDRDEERYRLAQEVRKSDEWLRLAKRIAAIEQQQDKESVVRIETSQPGQNINRMRKECGWSFDELARQTGIDKKSILSHVHKKSKPHPRIMKEYAQAFSKALDRPISVADLEK